MSITHVRVGGPRLLLAALLALAGCSSSSSPSASIGLTLSGPSAVRLGTPVQFTATVTGTSNTAVQWWVNGVPGGSAATGTISSTGLYTPPAAIPAGGSVTIRATSVADSSATGSLSESIDNPVPIVQSGSAFPSVFGTTVFVDLQGSGFVPGAAIVVNGTPAAATTVVSATDLQAWVTAPAGATTLSIAAQNPNPGSATSSAITISVTPLAATAAAAGRILDQATFGPTPAALQHVAGIGLDAWLNEQFATPVTRLAQIPTNPLPALCLASNTAYPCAESEWWQTAITAPDQLRQRVAFALSEMLVVSTQSIPGQAVPSYHNALAADAFGNFRTIMQDVATSPAMGAYLNMLNSAKPAAGQIANENFARENMQLFSLGLDLLNPDGTLQLDGSGNPIPVYTQAQVQAFARAYTGWTLANADGSTVTRFPNNSGDYADPMVPVAAQHDTTTKALLNNVVLSAGQTAQQDLNQALDNLFQHGNVGPFVCRQLIQHLVTSTPSPAYVARISAVFANNGNGVRGDMRAVLRAILTDTEARAGDSNPNFDGGHLREPILFLTAMMRLLAASNTDANGSWAALSNYSSALNERPYRANSVFNFFPPGYVLPGTTLNAPEFDIENTATTIQRLSLADSITNNRISGFSIDLSATSSLGTLAANPGALADYLSVALMHNQMPASMRSTIVSTITPLSSNAQRARIALFLVITSSQYKVIH